MGADGDSALAIGSYGQHISLGQTGSERLPWLATLRHRWLPRASFNVVSAATGGRWGFCACHWQLWTTYRHWADRLKAVAMAPEPEAAMAAQATGSRWGFWPPSPAVSTRSAAAQGRYVVHSCQ